MQKKLIALAVAGAFAAPAFAATSNVDVYGQINMSLERVDDGAESFSRMVSNNNSFIGFKGSEDLGGGLSAVWQIEANLSTDGNATTASGSYSFAATGTLTGTASASNSSTTANNNINGTRNTYIGLSSKTLGTVIAGVHDTPYKMATGGLDIFVGTLGDYNGMFGAAGTATGSARNPSAVFDLRTGNTIAYLSPNFSGFDFKAAYVMGLEGTETTSRSSAYSLSGSYNNGPLFVTAAYERHNDVGTTACNVGAVCLGQGTAGDRKAWKVGVGYKIGDLKLGALYEKMDDDIDVIGHNTWGLNAAYAMGAITLKGSYAKAGELDETNDSGATMYALGVDYALSKRTTVQLTYARMNNDTNGRWSLGQGPQVNASADGEDASGYSLGVRHSF